jgi:hypothetical protein
LAELARITVAEALASTDYPILLRERRLRISDETLKTFFWIAGSVNIALLVLVSWSSDGTRIEWHYNLILLEIASAVVWGLIFLFLWILRLEVTLLLTRQGMEARVFQTLKRQIEWRDIASITPARQDVHFTLLTAPERQIALFADIYAVPSAETCFGASVADVQALLEAHRAANTAPRS